MKSESGMQSNGCMSEHIIDRFFICVVGVIVTSVLIAVIYVGFSLITSTGKTDYCYVRTEVVGTYSEETPNFKRHILYAHRPWRHDEVIARTEGSIQEMFDAAHAMNCEVK